MSQKSDQRLSKLASFGASAGRRQADASAEAPGTGEEGPGAAAQAELAARKATAGAQPMIRNIAFTDEEQKILRTLMEALREAGEMTPNLSLAVKVGLRLVPKPISAEALHEALHACKALDGRRREAKHKSIK